MQKSLSLLRLGAFYLMERTVSRPKPYKGACGSLDTVHSIRIVLIKRNKDRIVRCTKIKSG